MGKWLLCFSNKLPGVLLSLSGNQQRLNEVTVPSHEMIHCEPHVILIGQFHVPIKQIREICLRVHVPGHFFYIWTEPGNISSLFQYLFQAKLVVASFLRTDLLNQLSKRKQIGSINQTIAFCFFSSVSHVNHSFSLSDSLSGSVTQNSHRQNISRYSLISASTICIIPIVMSLLNLMKLLSIVYGEMVRRDRLRVDTQHQLELLAVQFKEAAYGAEA